MRGTWFAHIVLLLLLLAVLAWGLIIIPEETSVPHLMKESASTMVGAAETYLPRLILVVLLYFVFVGISFFVFDVLMRKLLEYDTDESKVSGVVRIFRVILWTVFVLAALSILFGNIGALLTSLGLIGFGITFALQKPIMNFVGWFTILVKGIYTVGDRVKIGAVRGDVKDISVMNTVVDGLLPHSDMRSGKVVTLPNEAVLTQDVENYTKESNYLVDELSITVTYESNHKKARELLYEIATAITKQNKKNMKKNIKEQKATIQHKIGRLTNVLKKKKGKQKENIKEEIRKLKNEREELKEQPEDLTEEFKPRIRLELQDSAIELICQFITPYDSIKANRTRINDAFLDKIAKEPDIEIAYPHMQLVTHSKTAPEGVRITRGK